MKTLVLRIRFKEDTDHEHFQELNPKLRGIVLDLATYCSFHFNRDIMVTSLFRLENKKSVHAYGRGADIRSLDFNAEEIAQIERYLNTTYIYDPSRPNKLTCLYHNVGFGDHFHLQVMG